jgi:hypothetical protein
LFVIGRRERKALLRFIYWFISIRQALTGEAGGKQTTGIETLEAVIGCALTVQSAEKTHFSELGPVHTGHGPLIARGCRLRIFPVSTGLLQKNYIKTGTPSSVRDPSL